MPSDGETYVLRLSPDADALVRVLTLAARLPGAVARLTHDRAVTRLEMSGLTPEFAELLANRLRGLPCVERVHYLPGHGPSAAGLAKVGL